MQIQVLEGVVPKPTEDQAASEASAAAVDAAPAGSGTAPASSSAPHVTATGVYVLSEVAQHTRPSAFVHAL